MGIKSVIPYACKIGLHIEMGLLFLSDTKASANATMLTVQFQVLHCNPVFVLLVIIKILPTIWDFSSVGHSNIKLQSYKYRNSHFKDETHKSHECVVL